MKKIYFLISLLIILVAFSPASGQKVVTLQPGPEVAMDTYICSVLPYHVGYADGFLVTAWTLDGTPYVGMNVLKFDLSKIPQGAKINDARLSLYYDPDGSWSGHYGLNASFIKRVTSAWDRNTVCWNNKPSSTETGKIDIPEITDPYQDLTDIDVTHFVEGWVADPSSNFGVIMGLYEQNPYACLILSSSIEKDSTKWPKLVITYDGCTLPVAGFTATTSGLTSVFTDASVNAQSWQWDFGDGSSSTIQNPVHTFSAQGKHHVCLTVQDSCGSNTFCDTVTTICIPPITTWYYSSHGSYVEFFDTTAGATSWFWNFGDEYTDTVKNPFHQYEYEGIYHVCLTVHDSCGTDTHCDTVVAYSKLAKMFSTRSQGQLVIFTDPTENAVSRLWNFGDGTTSGLQNPAHLYANPGEYNVCLKVKTNTETQYGCESLIVLPNGPNSVNSAITFYPNPVADYLVLHRVNLAQDYADVTITDLQGVHVYSGSISFQPGQTEYSIDLKSLSSGLYFLRITSDSNSKVLKFVKAD